MTCTCFLITNNNNLVQSFSIVRVKPLKLKINVEDQTALKKVLILQTFIAKVSPGQMLCR